LASALLERIRSNVAEGSRWADEFGLDREEGGFYSVFKAIRDVDPLGLRGETFVLKADELEGALSSGDGECKFGGYFTFDDLAKAVEDDFLDAGRGTTDNRKGWKMATVSNPRGDSFEEARMTLDDVDAALEKGTVVFNSAGAHIPKLAGAALGCVDAMSLPNAINMYVTAPGRRTSAPPHTDKQDVLVVQTSGSKHWRVYSPPIPSIDRNADMFARGKGDDAMPLYSFERDYGCRLLLETTLETGDALFIPGGFPHTTDTSRLGRDETSIHLTFGVDTHIWDLDYLQVRRLALKRAGGGNDALGKLGDTDNPYVGAVNELPIETLRDLIQHLPLGFLDEGKGEDMLGKVTDELVRVSKSVDADGAAALDPAVWAETSERVLRHGREMLEIHRDMYLSAVEEGRLRISEAAMTSHLDEKSRRMTPEQMQRLSVFRVRKYFDKIAESNKDLMEWTAAGNSAASGGGDGGEGEGGGAGGNNLPADWAITLPLSVGDVVEADLGGAFFDATVTGLRGSTYDVQFFDGDKEEGLRRDMIKLKEPPAKTDGDNGGEEEEFDTSGMTPKELKRWRKKQQKKKNKK